MPVRPLTISVLPTPLICIALYMYIYPYMHMDVCTLLHTHIPLSLSLSLSLSYAHADCSICGEHSNAYYIVAALQPGQERQWKTLSLHFQSV